MRKIISALALVVALVAAPLGLADQVNTATLTTAAPSVSYSTVGYAVANVSVEKLSGSPDGTVQIYVDGYSVGTGGAYATPTTKKIFRGPVGGQITVILSGNTTGTVAVEVRLK